MEPITLQKIIEAYGKDHIVEGLFLEYVQDLPEQEILDILLGANGRDIVGVPPDDENTLDGEVWQYIGEEDKDFDWSKYFA